SARACSSSTSSPTMPTGSPWSRPTSRGASFRSTGVTPRTSSAAASSRVRSAGEASITGRSWPRSRSREQWRAGAARSFPPRAPPSRSGGSTCGGSPPPARPPRRLGAASLALMGVLMTVAIQYVVDRPIRRFMDAISAAAEDGAPAPVTVTTTDEFGVLARHFNEMVARIARFSEELRTRIAEATGELDHRVRQVEQLNVLLYEMQRRLSHAERLALSGRVMAEVAHEVGTPLHSVAGHLELLRRDLPPGLLS